MASSDASKPNKGRPGLTIGLEMFRASAASLVKLRKELPADLEPKEFRELVIALGDEIDLPFLARLASCEQGEGLGSAKLREVLQLLLDQAFAGREDLTVGEALRWVDENSGTTKTILDLVTKMAANEQVSPVVDLLGGHCLVSRFPIGEGLKLPVMVAVATPFTPRKEWLNEVSYRFQRDFAPMAQMKPASLLEAARAAPGWLEDRESRDIADKLFEEEGYRAQLKRDHPEKSAAERERLYAKAIGKRAARLRKRKEHFVEVVKKVMGGTSQA